MHQELAGALGVIALDHTAIAVRDIDAALPLYRDLLGGKPLGSGKPRPTRSGFQFLALAFPNGSNIELLAPLGDGGFLHDFLDKRGEGVHHLTFRVQDVRAAVERAKAAGPARRRRELHGSTLAGGVYLAPQRVRDDRAVGAVGSGSRAA